MSAATLLLSLSSGLSCAQLVINVTPTANARISIADLKNDPNITVSLDQALTILKEPELRDASGELKESIIISLGSGIYRPIQTLYIDEASSGNIEYPITIEGPKDASAIISGGRIISGFTNVTDIETLRRLPEGTHSQIVQTNLPNQGITDYGHQSRHGWGAEHIPTALQLFFNNKPMQLARWPNQEFARISRVPEGENGFVFTVKGAHLAQWKSEPDLLALGYWYYDWADTTIPVKGIDILKQQIRLTKPKPPFGVKTGQRVLFQNALAELDEPGEWYLNKANGLLYFWPPRPIEDNESEVSLLENLLVINNAKQIRISGLTFTSARGDAVTVKGGDHISISNSIIRNIGNNGAIISGQDNGLTDMLIENIGESGVVLNGGDRQTLTPANLYVEHSTIRNFQTVTRTNLPGVLLKGVGNRVIGNKIYNAPQTGINFTGNNHLISLNEVFDVCKETGDAGAIYVGRDWTAQGTVISNNYIHDVPPNIEWGRTKAVYLDDQSSGITIRGNLFQNIYQAVFIGGGRSNLIENNTFLNAEVPIYLDARGKNWQIPMIDNKRGGALLLERLKLVPYNQTPYITHYPHLANILEDDFGAPKYNIARSNMIIGKYKFNISKDALAGITIFDLSVLSDINHYLNP